MTGRIRDALETDPFQEPVCLPLGGLGSGTTHTELAQRICIPRRPPSSFVTQVNSVSGQSEQAGVAPTVGCNVLNLLERFQEFWWRISRPGYDGRHIGMPA